MKTIKLILLILALSVLKVTANSTVEFQASSFIKVDKKATLVQSDMNRFDFDLVDVEANKIFNSGKNHMVVKNFPLRPDYKVDLVLSKQKSPLTDDVEIKYFKNGKKVNYERENYNRYFGHIAGAQKSDVFISYSSVGLVGYIQDEMGMMYDVSADMSKLGSDVVPHNVSETSIGKMFDQKPIDQCGFDGFEDFDPSLISPDKEKFATLQKDDLLEIKFAADGNFEYYLMFCWFITQGSYTNWEQWYVEMTDEQHEQALKNAVDYIENIMAASSRIYNREVALMLKVPYITIFNDPVFDPYYDKFGQTLSTKLGSMNNIWLGRQDEATDRVLATVFTDVNRQPGNSTTLGIAYSGQNYNGTLCSKGNGFSALGMRGNVNFPRVRFSTDVQVAAHEFGHNFGCPHTHFCGWPQMGQSIIDSCVSANLADDAFCISTADRRRKQDGTIMSYCHFGGSIIFDFHPRMKDRIRSAAINKLSSCINKPNYPVVRLIRPLGDEVYFANGKTKIAFNAANVPQAKLLYSRNMGEDWEEIAVVNTTNDTTYEWDIPSEVGTEYMVRIESTSDASVFDQSVLPFEVTDFSVNPDFPQPGDKVGYLAEQRLSWVKQNVGEVNIKYSIDGGDSWKTIVTGENITSYNYNFPNVASDNAILLVESVENPTVNMEVPFILDMENVVFTKPLAGDTISTNLLEFEVEFEREFIVDDFDIFYKSNQSGTWKLLSNFANKVDLENNNFIWILNDDINPGDIGELQARVKDNPTSIGETGVFFFDEITSVKEFSDAFRISSITPNPAENNFNLTVSNGFGKLMNTTIKIIGTDGKIYQTLSNQFMSTGKSTPIKIDVSDLTVGTYYVIIESGKYKDVQQLKVIR